jgi:hypothetical protein
MYAAIEIYVCLKSSHDRETRHILLNTPFSFDFPVVKNLSHHRPKDIVA